MAKDVIAPEPVEPPLEKRDPKSMIGLDRHGTGVFEYIALAEDRDEHGQPTGRPRTVAFDGLVFERTAADVDGVSLYRRERF